MLQVVAGQSLVAQRADVPPYRHGRLARRHRPPDRAGPGKRRVRRGVVHDTGGGRADPALDVPGGRRKVEVGAVEDVGEQGGAPSEPLLKRRADRHPAGRVRVQRRPRRRHVRVAALGRHRTQLGGGALQLRPAVRVQLVEVHGGAEERAGGDLVQLPTDTVHLGRGGGQVGTQEGGEAGGGGGGQPGALGQPVGERPARVAGDEPTVVVVADPARALFGDDKHLPAGDQLPTLRSAAQGGGVLGEGGG